MQLEDPGAADAETDTALLLQLLRERVF